MSPSRQALVLTIALAACAPAQWQKPGASADTVKADTEACRTQARLQSPPPFASTQPSATVTTNTLTREEQLAAYEAEQFQKCMLAKGYNPGG